MPTVGERGEEVEEGGGKEGCNLEAYVPPSGRAGVHYSNEQRRKLLGKYVADFYWRGF